MLQIQTDETKYRYCESTENFHHILLFEGTFNAKNIQGFQLQLRSCS